MQARIWFDRRYVRVAWTFSNTNIWYRSSFSVLLSRCHIGRLLQLFYLLVQLRTCLTYITCFKKRTLSCQSLIVISLKAVPSISINVENGGYTRSVGARQMLHSMNLPFTYQPPIKFLCWHRLSLIWVCHQRNYFCLLSKWCLGILRSAILQNSGIMSATPPSVSKWFVNSYNSYTCTLFMYIEYRTYMSVIFYYIPAIEVIQCLERGP